jgi:hypothetical protein
MCLELFYWTLGLDEDLEDVKDGISIFKGFYRDLKEVYILILAIILTQFKYLKLLYLETFLNIFTRKKLIDWKPGKGYKVKWFGVFCDVYIWNL